MLIGWLTSIFFMRRYRRSRFERRGGRATLRGARALAACGGSDSTLKWRQLTELDHLLGIGRHHDQLSVGWWRADNWPMRIVLHICRRWCNDRPWRFLNRCAGPIGRWRLGRGQAAAAAVARAAVARPSQYQAAVMVASTSPHPADAYHSGAAGVPCFWRPARGYRRLGRAPARPHRDVGASSAASGPLSVAGPSKIITSAASRRCCTSSRQRSDGSMAGAPLGWRAPATGPRFVVASAAYRPRYSRARRRVRCSGRLARRAAAACASETTRWYRRRRSALYAPTARIGRPGRARTPCGLRLAAGW